MIRAALYRLCLAVAYVAISAAERLERDMLRRAMEDRDED